MLNSTRKTGVLIVVAMAAAAWAGGGIRATRNVELTYTATIEKFPEAAKVIDLWLPVAQDTDGQTVSSVTVAYPEGGSIAVESRYGNKIWHRRFVAPFKGELREGKLSAQLVFRLHREEIIVPEAKSLAPVTKIAKPSMTYLEANRLIPVKIEPVRQIVTRLHLENEPPIRAARKVYDWLIDEFTYNYLAPGAGRGDVVWACNAKTGDCSDYHSTFIAVCRNLGIPADHEFGFLIRTKEHAGEIKSYHCWARFQVEGVGWIPLDASEADKHPELREYNFGSQSVDLLKFSHGRDVTLVPSQSGPPLNRFIYPYAEADGKPLATESVKFAVFFKDIAP